MKIAGIKRETTYSPNHISNDAMIFNLTVENLKELGVEVIEYEEEKLDEIVISEKNIFSMAQGSFGVHKLLEYEKDGFNIINTPTSAINTYRYKMIELIPGAGIPFPKSLLININVKIDDNLFQSFNTRKIWVKRGSVHAVHREDVTAVYSQDELVTILREFKQRGIEQAVLQEHLDGDVVKFYSISDKSFFHWYYLNGINHTPFDEKKLIELADKSAKALGIDVYGGDAIISADGSISIIDINDWPSFAPIRDEAAKCIAKLIYHKIIGIEMTTKRKYAKVITEIPGEKSLAKFNEEQNHIAPGVQTIATRSKIVIEKGEGCIVEDADGNRYIDFFAGVGVASLGYNHPTYNKLMTEQLNKIHVGSFTSENRVNLTKLLSDIAIGDLTKSQFYSGGAEAVEAALRMAKSYTKKTEFISFWNGFHGKTVGVLGLLGDSFKASLGPLPAGVYNTPYAQCRHCEFNTSLDKCSYECVEFIKKKIRYETTNNIAAIIVEPIQGTAGNVLPAPDFLKKLRTLADEIGALLICDEMICGFGRTGKMFGTEHYGIIPDIITIGKGFGNGFPIAGVMSRDEIINAKPFGNPSGSSSSYGGNPMASTAAYATVKTIIEEGLVENSAKIGALMLEKFKEMQERIPIIGEVRGKGLMIGIELVKERGSKEKLDKKYTEMVFHECLKRGLIVMGYNPDIRIYPPLIINEELALEGIEIMEEAFKHVAEQL